MTLQPSPLPTASDVVDVPLAYPKARGVVCSRSTRPDEQHVILGEFCCAGPFAAIVRAVQDLILLVLGARFPRQMPFRDAAIAPAAAGVSGVMLRRRRFAMYPFAQVAAHDTTSLAPNRHVRIPVRIAGKGPDQALIAFMGHDHVGKKVGSGSAVVFDDQRISVSAKPIVVQAAPSKRIMALVAILDRAYPGLSHLDLSSGWAWLERAIGRPAFGAFALPTTQGQGIK